jgi:hypothetical protein
MVQIASKSGEKMRFNPQLTPKNGCGGFRHSKNCNTGM